MFRKSHRIMAEVVTSIQSRLWYNSLIIVLALGSVGLLLYEVWLGVTVPVITEIDFLIACIFLLDFLFGLFFNQNYLSRRAYCTDNWLNFISSIPISSEITQLLRVARVWRAVRVIQLGVNIWTTHKQITAQAKKKETS